MPESESAFWARIKRIQGDTPRPHLAKERGGRWRVWIRTVSGEFPSMYDTNRAAAWLRQRHDGGWLTYGR